MDLWSSIWRWYMLQPKYRKISHTSDTRFQNLKFLILSYCCRWPIHLSQVFSIYWRCSWILQLHLSYQQLYHLTDDIVRRIFVNEKFCIWLKFPWSLFLSVQLTIFSIGSDNGLVPNRQQAIIWTNGDAVHWCIYAELGGDELITK